MTLLVGGEGDAARSAPVMTPDGRYLLYAKGDFSGRDIWEVPLGPKGVTEPLEGERRPFLAAPREQHSYDVSPDGRFVAYMSSEGGTTAPFVTTFPTPTGRWQLPPASPGSRPRWSAKGTSIFQVSEQGELVELPVDRSSAFTITGPGQVFRIARVPAGFGILFDRSLDGTSVVVPTSAETSGRADQLMLIFNWAGK